MPKIKTDLGFEHVYAPALNGSPRTLLLLHGTGGDEKDLLGLGAALDIHAGLLSPRGKVLDAGMPRFFRRLAMGVFDVEDLKFRTHELAAFVASAAREYGFDARQVIAVGYSNGANIAAGLLLLEPEVLAGAILFRPMIPLTPDKAPDLSTTAVWIAGGRRDPIVRPEETERLANLLRGYGADVWLEWDDGGHELARAELENARRWLESRMV